MYVLQNSPVYSATLDEQKLIPFSLTLIDANYSTEAEDIENLDSMLIDISILRSATGDFAESNKLGEGGFGAVYKVWEKKCMYVSESLSNSFKLIKLSVCFISHRVCSQTATR